MIKKVFADGSAHKEEDQTRVIIKDVAQQIAKRIGNTLGPGGRNYMTPDGITNDGVSILGHLRFEDERKDAIADAFEEVARRQDQDAGDGTTTATLLTCALTPLVLDEVGSIETPLPGYPTVMDIKRKLEEESKKASSLLEEMAEPCESLEQLEAIASTSMEGHASAPLIAKTVFELGGDSIINLEEGYSGDVTTTVVAGIHYPLKIEAHSMYTNQVRKEAIHEKPLVVVANHVFESYAEIAPFMSSMLQEKRAQKEAPQPIVIIGKQFSVQFTAEITGVSRQTGLPILLLGAASLRDEEFQDIADYVNARYVDFHPKEGSNHAPLMYADAGTAKKVIAGRDQCAFTEGAGIEAGRVSTRVADLNKLAEAEQNPNMREELLRRSAGMQGGVATVYVDAKTAVDRYYLKKKVEDAVNSCKAAMKHGTLPGGGVALSLVGDLLGPDSYLGRALPVIHKRVVQNAGGDLYIDLDKVRDPYWTLKCAVENATAVAKLLVTTEGIIADRERDFTDELTARLQ